MHQTVRNIGIVLRSERLILQQHMSVAATRSWFVGLAILVAVLGLVMFNAAGFLALRPVNGAPLAALIVGVADFAVAGIVAALGARLDPQRDLRAVTEVRDIALRDLEDDMRTALDTAERLRGRAEVYARDPAGMVLGKIIEQVLEGLRRR